MHSYGAFLNRDIPPFGKKPLHLTHLLQALTTRHSKPRDDVRCVERHCSRCYLSTLSYIPFNLLTLGLAARPAGRAVVVSRVLREHNAQLALIRRSHNGATRQGRERAEREGEREENVSAVAAPAFMAHARPSLLKVTVSASPSVLTYSRLE
jgi:hypothetical protein